MGIGLAMLAVGGFGLWRFTREPSLAEMERQGELESVPFRATRCFQMEDVGEHGPLYLIQLDTGEALYVGGQWLAHLEPVDDEDPADNAPRRFPCTEFTAVRRRADREIVDLRCAGRPLEPEAVKQFFVALPDLEVPESGDVLPMDTYADLKTRLPDGRL